MARWPHQSVLITGGSGSFGRAFARYCLEAGAQRICIYSRGEHAQALMREEIGASDQDKFRWFIGDVRDAERLEQAMAGVTLVVHAAALKRVEVGEYNPIEMARTNIIGAINIIQGANRAARHAPGHLQVVALSTDKASAPLNAYGASKLMAEKLFLAANHMFGERGPAFSVTRYGNVAGSQGSVIPTWRRAKEAGVKARLSDPFATRFWMTLKEAVELVAWTATEGPRILVVPKLPAYKMGDLIRAMGIEHFTVPGLGTGEKLHETMVSQDEAPEFLSLEDHLLIRPHDGIAWRQHPRVTAAPAQGLNSYHAPQLTVQDLREKLKGIQ